MTEREKERERGGWRQRDRRIKRETERVRQRDRQDRENKIALILQCPRLYFETMREKQTRSDHKHLSDSLFTTCTPFAAETWENVKQNELGGQKLAEVLAAGVAQYSLAF